MLHIFLFHVVYLLRIKGLKFTTVEITIYPSLFYCKIRLRINQPITVCEKRYLTKYDLRFCIVYFNIIIIKLSSRSNEMFNPFIFIEKLYITYINILSFTSISKP